MIRDFSRLRDVLVDNQKDIFWFKGAYRDRSHQQQKNASRPAKNSH